MRYVNQDTKLNIDINTEFVLYDKHGKVTQDSRHVFCQVLKTIKIDGSEKRRYYIATYNSMLYDPMGPDGHRKNIQFAMKEVTQQVFDFYLMYLNTKNSLYMTKAQRSFING